MLNGNQRLAFSAWNLYSVILFANTLSAKISLLFFSLSGGTLLKKEVVYFFKRKGESLL